jgi:hypothetical protein
MWKTCLLLLAGTLATAGCGKSGKDAGKQQPAATAAPAGDSGKMSGMGGMQMDSTMMGGHQMSMDGPAMMPMMRAHMDSMARMSPDQMAAMMAMHDRRMSQMMDRMGADMRSRHMSGDAKWTALMDSVKADLADLPGLQGKELSARMNAHRDRMRRLMAMHEGMMKGTEPK